MKVLGEILLANCSACLNMGISRTVTNFLTKGHRLEMSNSV